MIGISLLRDLLQRQGTSIRDGGSSDLPSIDPVTAISMRDDPSKVVTFMRIPTEPDAMDRLKTARSRGMDSWCHVLIAHCSQIVRRAVSGSDDLDCAVKDLMETCAIWLTQIEGQRATADTERHGETP